MLPLTPTNQPRVIDYEDEHVTIKGSISFKEMNPLAEAVDPAEESLFKPKAVIILSKSSSPAIQITVGDEDKLASQMDEIIEEREVIWVDDYEFEKLPSINEGEMVVKQEPTEKTLTGSKVQVKFEGENSTKASALTSLEYRVEDDPEYERLCEIDPKIRDCMEIINHYENFSNCPSILAPLGYYVFVRKDTWRDILRAALKEQLESFFVFKAHEYSYTVNLLAKHSIFEKVIFFEWKYGRSHNSLTSEISGSLKYAKYSIDCDWQGEFWHYADQVMKTLVSGNQGAIFDYLKENKLMIPKLGYSLFDSMLDLFPDSGEETENSQKNTRSATPIECAINLEDASYSDSKLHEPTYSDGPPSPSSESPEPRRLTPRKRTRSGRRAALAR